MQEDKETAWGTLIYMGITFVAMVAVKIALWLTAMKFILYVGNALNYRVEPLLILYVIQAIMGIQVKIITNEIMGRR